MRQLRHLRAQDYKRLPWKNGLGFTDELAIYPSSSTVADNNFLWRISAATIAEDCAFSDFPDYERVLVILSGGGVRLAHGEALPAEHERWQDLALLQPYHFSGALPTRCRLQAGGVADLNVFARRGQVTTEVTVASITADTPHRLVAGPGWHYLFAAQGAFNTAGQRYQSGACLAIEVGEEGLSTPEAFLTTGAGQLVVISLRLT